MSIEESFARANPTPEQLLDAIPIAVPMDRGEVLLARPGYRGCYAMAMDKLPTEQLDWNQLFNLQSRVPPGPPPPPGSPPPGVADADRDDIPMVI